MDPDETAQWAVSSGSTLFDIQSFKFTYKRVSKRSYVEIKKQTTNVVWNLSPKEVTPYVLKYEEKKQQRFNPW